MEVKDEDVKELRRRLDVGPSVAHELLQLSGGDVDLAEWASLNSRGLDQCKALIIDCRLKNLEERQ